MVAFVRTDTMRQKFLDSKGEPVSSVRINFKVHPDLHAALVKLAKQRKQSFTKLVVGLIEGEIEKEKK